jgi:hypothetical protein
MINEETVIRSLISCFHVKSGDVGEFDCVDIYKQPAFDHPLLKNHKIQVIANIFYSFNILFFYFHLLQKIDHILLNYADEPKFLNRKDDKRSFLKKPTCGYQLPTRNGTNTKN